MPSPHFFKEESYYSIQFSDQVLLFTTASIVVVRVITYQECKNGLLLGNLSIKWTVLIAKGEKLYIIVSKDPQEVVSKIQNVSGA